MREARTYNQAAETVHAGLGRISSRIRLSLSLRIAGHYCGRLARTFLLAAVIMTLALAAGNVPGAISLARRVATEAPDLNASIATTFTEVWSVIGSSVSRLAV